MKLRKCHTTIALSAQLKRYLNSWIYFSINQYIHKILQLHHFHLRRAAENFSVLDNWEKLRGRRLVLQQRDDLIHNLRWQWEKLPRPPISSARASCSLKSWPTPLLGWFGWQMARAINSGVNEACPEPYPVSRRHLALSYNKLLS